LDNGFAGDDGEPLTTMDPMRIDVTVWKPGEPERVIRKH
jgi:hypothetical protein